MNLGVLNAAEIQEGLALREDNGGLGDGWKEVIGDRKVVSMVCLDAGMAEECLSMIQFEGDVFEVGIGEALRPYRKLYEGDNNEEATEAFMKAASEMYELRKDDEAPCNDGMNL